MKINRQQVFDKYNGHCAYCGCEISNKWQVDHIWPKSDGGSNDISNLNPACCSCNNYKSTHDLEFFRKEIHKQVERLRRDKPTFRMAERFGQITCNQKPVIFYFEGVMIN